MAFGAYKEGQGIWVRGVMATTIFVVALYAAFRMYDWLYVEEGGLFKFLQGSYDLPIGWTLDMRLIPVGVLLAGFLGFGMWAYNYPKFVDFLIDTENELRTRVTWPTRKELVHASTVVVVAVVLIAIWVLFSDWVFVMALRKGIYKVF